MNTELKSILADTLGISEARLAEEASTETLPEWDSVAHINIVLSLEARYGLSFSPDEILNLGSIREIERILQQRGVVD